MATKRIGCGDPNCNGVIAHQVTDKTFEIKLLDQSMLMSGENWSTLASCPWNPKHQTAITVTDGKVDTSIVPLRYLDEENDDDHKTNDNDEE